MQEEENKKETVAVVRRLNLTNRFTPIYEMSFLKNVKSGEKLSFDPTGSYIFRLKKIKK